MSCRALILSVGHVPQLLQTRTLLLRSAGYGVREETDCNLALQAAIDEDIDLVLLCHSLLGKEIRFLVTTLATHRRLLPVLCVRKTDFSKATENAPDQLLHDVELLLPDLPQTNSQITLIDRPKEKRSIR